MTFSRFRWANACSVYDVESSPQTYARVGGALYLMLIGLGGVGLFARDTLIVGSDAAVTAVNITTNESLWRLGIAAELVALICAIVLAMIYFVLLEPVSRELNLVATFLRLVATAIQAVAHPESRRRVVSTWKRSVPESVYAGPALRNDAAGNQIARVWLRPLSTVFFGSCFLAHGRLIFRSGFLPKSFGHSDSGCRFELSDEQLHTILLAPNISRADIPRHSSSRLYRGGVTLLLASRERCQRREVAAGLGRHASATDRRAPDVHLVSIGTDAS